MYGFIKSTTYAQFIVHSIPLYTVSVLGHKIYTVKYRPSSEGIPDGNPKGKGQYWVNPSKRGGMDKVFRGLAGLLQRNFSRTKPEGNPEEQPCQPKENPIHPNSFTCIYILFKIGHFGDISDFFKY